MQKVKFKEWYGKRKAGKPTNVEKAKKPVPLNGGDACEANVVFAIDEYLNSIGVQHKIYVQNGTHMEMYSTENGKIGDITERGKKLHIGKMDNLIKGVGKLLNAMGISEGFNKFVSVVVPTTHKRNIWTAEYDIDMSDDLCNIGSIVGDIVIKVGDQRKFISIKSASSQLSLAGYGLTTDYDKKMNSIFKNLFDLDEIKSKKLKDAVMASYKNFNKENPVDGSESYKDYIDASDEYSLPLNSTWLKNLLLKSVGCGYWYLRDTTKDVEYAFIGRRMLETIVDDIVAQNKTAKVYGGFILGTSKSFILNLKSKYIKNLTLKIRNSKGGITPNTFDIGYGGFTNEVFDAKKG